MMRVSSAQRARREIIRAGRCAPRRRKPLAAADRSRANPRSRRRRRDLGSDTAVCAMHDHELHYGGARILAAPQVVAVRYQSSNTARVLVIGSTRCYDGRILQCETHRCTCCRYTTRVLLRRNKVSVCNGGR